MKKQASRKESKDLEFTNLSPKEKPTASLPRILISPRSISSRFQRSKIKEEIDTLSREEDSKRTNNSLCKKISSGPQKSSDSIKQRPFSLILQKKGEDQLLDELTKTFSQENKKNTEEKLIPKPQLELYKRQHSDSRDYLANYISNQGQFRKDLKKSKNNLGNSIGTERKRQLTIQEMIDTEKTYLEFLQTVITMFIVPVKKSLNDARPLLTQEGINFIFQNIEKIRELNMEFLKIMVKRKTKSTIKWCDLFISTFSQEEFKIAYQQYINGYNSAVDLLSRLMKGTLDCDQYKHFGDLLKFKELVQRQLQHTLCLGFSSLSSFLITPVQRLPRYLLLLREIKKYTSDSHPDYNYVTEAYNILEEITATIEKEKSMYDEVSRIQQLYHRFSENHRHLINEINDPIRKLLAEGPMLEMCFGTLPSISDLSMHTAATTHSPSSPRVVPRDLNNSINNNNHNNNNNINSNNQNNQSLTHNTNLNLSLNFNNNNNNNNEEIYVLRYIIIFSDMIICASKEKEKLFLEWKVDLFRSLIQFVPNDEPNEEYFTVSDLAKDSNGNPRETKKKIVPHKLYPMTTPGYNMEYWKPHFLHLTQNLKDPGLFSANLNHISRAAAKIFNCDNWDIMYENSKTQAYQDGSIIIRKGDPSVEMSFVREGKCIIVNAETKEIVGSASQGECLSEVSYLQDDRNTMSSMDVFAADEIVKVAKVTFSNLDATLLSNSFVAKLFFNYVSLILLKRYLTVFLTGKYHYQPKDTPETNNQTPIPIEKQPLPQKVLFKLGLIRHETAIMIIQCKYTHHRKKANGLLYVFNNKVCFYSESKQVLKIISAHYIFKINEINNTTIIVDVHIQRISSSGFSIKSLELEFNDEADKLVIMNHFNNFISSRFSKKFFIDLSALQSNGIYTLDNSDWKILYRTGKELIFNEGEVIANNSLNTDQLFRIISGQCYVEVVDMNGNKSGHVLSNGDFFGEDFFLIGLVSFATITAKSEVNVISFDCRLLIQLLETSGDLCVGFYKQIAQSMCRKFINLTSDLPC